MNLIQVKKIKDDNLPSRSTLYKWNSKKLYPKLIIKICNQLFFNMDEWEVMAESAIERNVSEAKKYMV